MDASETLVHPQWFKADAVYHTARGTVFAGPAPFSFDNDPVGRTAFFRCPWVISHTEARKDIFYRVRAIETYAILHVGRGAMIGLLVEEVRE